NPRSREILSGLLCLASSNNFQELTSSHRAAFLLKVGESVSFSCGGTQQRSNDIYWYQKKDTEQFKIILHFNKNDCGINKGYGHPQKDDFTAEKTQRGCFCSTLSHCVSGDYYIFGSGTRLFVTAQPVVKPVVSVYPGASRVHVEGSSSLLCLASAMFPPVVQFSWKRQKNNGPLEDLLPTGKEELDFRESGHIISILLVQQQEDSSYKYSCSIKHEGGTVEAQTQQGDEGLVTLFNRESL
uniref:Ig-like domain-containing protein n=1 Tax=Oryzias latipes TaxID=8090 RepID=A0A3P9JE12_ORYLA